MAEEVHKAAAVVEEVVVVSDVPEAEKSTIVEKEPASAPEPEAVSAPEPEAASEKPAAVAEEEAVVEETEKSKAAEESKITESASFKEESNVVGELPDPQKKALDEFKQLVQEALNKHEFTATPPPHAPVPANVEEKLAEEEKVPEKVAEEEPKPEEKIADDPPEPPPTAAPEESTSAPEASTAVVPQAETKEEKEEEKTPLPPAPETSETVVVAEVIEKITTAVDDDGAKTVEAIEETIVAVSVPAPPPEEPAPTTEPPPAEPKEEPESSTTAASPPPPPPEEVSIWGIPLLADDRSDVILLKFLRARDFKVKDAFTMLKNTVRWRSDFGIESLLEEDLGTDLEKAVFMHGFDKEGHPVCYNVYGEFQNKDLYQSSFSDEEKRQKFLRWRIQFLEKSIRKLDFSPDGICSFVQINDLKNSPGPFKREIRQATNQALLLLQDNYPEFVAKQVFINVPWWYLAFYRMISPFFTQRTKSKFMFAGASKTAETLFNYIAPEQVPVQYGGHSREGELEFTTAESVTEVTIKPASKHTVELTVSEGCTWVWEVRVIGWEVNYGAEFVPSTEGGYTVIVQKSRKILPADETVICGSFKTGEPGKVILTFDNQTSKKKKLLYRSKTKPFDGAS